VMSSKGDWTGLENGWRPILEETKPNLRSDGRIVRTSSVKNLAQE